MHGVHRCSARPIVERNCTCSSLESRTCTVSATLSATHASIETPPLHAKSAVPQCLKRHTADRLAAQRFHDSHETRTPQTSRANLDLKWARAWCGACDRMPMSDMEKPHATGYGCKETWALLTDSMWAFLAVLIRASKRYLCSCQRWQASPNRR